MLRKNNKNNMIRDTDFAQFLLQQQIVAPGKERYMIIWVRKFFSVRSSCVDKTWTDQLRIFLESLKKAGKYEDWQIRQAEQAVRIYFNNFRQSYTIDSNANAELSDNQSKLALNQVDAIAEFSKSMRLQNYARKTEKTYIHWVRQFLTYSHNIKSFKKISTIQLSGNVRDFLAYLAMSRNVAPSTQNLAFNALLLFFRIVYQVDLARIFHENLYPCFDCENISGC